MLNHVDVRGFASPISGADGRQGRKGHVEEAMPQTEEGLRKEDAS